MTDPTAIVLDDMTEAEVAKARAKGLAVIEADGLITDPEERRQIANQKVTARFKNGVLLFRADPLATALHEAAHCVFNTAFGATVKSATCFPFENQLFGRVETEERRMPAILILVDMLAGDLAEHRFISNGEINPGALMSDSDADEIRSVLRQIDPVNDVKQLHSTLVALTLNLVLVNMPSIAAVGLEIYAHKTISGETVRSILKQTGFYQPDNQLLIFAQEAYEKMKVAGMNKFVTQGVAA
jgi:hypothetical protein